jgi:hypothetical protein
MLTGTKASKTHGKATPNLNLLDVEESGAVEVKGKSTVIWRRA